jgi:hypothetical protein
MTDFVAVVAANLHGIGLGDLLLWAALGDMANFIAVGALGHQTRNRLSGVLEALEVLFLILGPQLALGGARRVPLSTVSDLELLVQMALEIHQGEGGQNFALNGNEPNGDLLLAECALQLDVGGLGDCLDVDLDRFLDIVNVTSGRDLLDIVPSGVLVHVRNIAAVNLAGLLALRDGVACVWMSSALLLLHHEDGSVGCHTSVTAILANTVGAVFDKMLSRTALTALGRGSIRTILAHVALLAAGTAGAREDARLGALRLPMANKAVLDVSQMKAEEWMLTQSRHS